MISYAAVANDDSKELNQNAKPKGPMKISIKSRCFRFMKMARDNLYTNLKRYYSTVNFGGGQQGSQLNCLQFGCENPEFDQTCHNVSSTESGQRESSPYSWGPGTSLYSDNADGAFLWDDDLCSTCVNHSVACDSEDACSLCRAEFAAAAAVHGFGPGRMQDYVPYSDHSYLCTESTCPFVAKMELDLINEEHDDGYRCSVIGCYNEPAVGSVERENGKSVKENSCKYCEKRLYRMICVQYI